jgi:hypothetical protein
MTEYFIRFSDCEEWLRCDADRGYSFNAYQFANSPEEFEEMFGAFSGELEQNSNGQWGIALDGLCGFGPLETLEEAEEAVRNRCYGIYTVAGIFTGREVYDSRNDDGTCFRPDALVKTIDSQEVALA